MKQLNKGQRYGGFAAFLSILVVSSVALAVSVSISLLGISEAKSSLDFRKGKEALKVADACMEEALLRLRNDESYFSGSLSVNEGSCTINVSGDSSNKTIDIDAQMLGVQSYSKRVQVNIIRTGNSVNIIDWSEIE